MKWFSSNISTVEELRREYRRLAKLHHPDTGGNTENMKEINAEFDTFSLILSHREATQEKKKPQDTAEENEAFKVVIARMVSIGIEAEIIGSWIWIHGGYEYRELLKSIGFKFAPKKKAWCWHFGEYRRHHKREVTLDEIRAKYGSERVNNRRERKAVAGG